MALMEDPTKHPLVEQVLAGAKRVLAKPTVKKEPITADILKELVTKHGGEGASLSDIRTLAICLVSFAGFFRYDEVSRLKEADVVFYDDHMELYIESSKTDQFRDGAWVVVARTCSSLCPFNMLDRYMKMALIGENQDEYIFRGIVKTKKGAMFVHLVALAIPE